MKLVAILVAGLGPALFSVSVARAQATPASCSFNAQSATVTVNVNGDPAALTASGGVIRLDGAPCGVATVSNTDSIQVNGGALADNLTVTGNYSPGLTAEIDGNSEIEFSFSMGTKRDTLKVNLTNNPDVLSFGQGGIDRGNDGDQDMTTTGVEVIRVYGKNGNDIIDASEYGWGEVYLYGGDGIDTLVGTVEADFLYGNAGADFLYGGQGDDQLQGGSGDDAYFGEGGDDTMTADATVDGADEFYGGAGTDEVTYEKRASPVTVTMGNGAADDGEAGELDYFDLDVEDVTGGAGADNLTGSPSANTIYGGAGNDVISAGNANDYVHGEDGDDVISAGDGNDLVYGEDGNDTVTGGPGADDLYGSVGVDDLSGGDGDDFAFGGDGNDIIRGQAGSDYLSGGANDDTLYGGDGWDYFFGDTGDDTIYNRDVYDENVDCGEGLDLHQVDGDDYTDCEGTF